MTPPGRRWLEIGARSASAGESADLLAEGLVALGGRAVEERDGWYVTHVPEPADPRAFLEGVRAHLCAHLGLDDVEIRHSWRPQEAWEESWKRGLRVRRVSERIVVRPSWLEYRPRPGEVVIVIDPAMAFGTAEHGTTRGCLRLLDGLVEPGSRVLDVGAGSGILAIAAAHLGAREVIAVEGDPLAHEALHENIDRAGVAERVRVVPAWADVASLAGMGPADGVVANIDAGVLRALLPGLRDALRPGGWLLLSGVTEEVWPDLVAAAGPLGLGPGPVDADGAWRTGVFRHLP